MDMLFYKQPIYLLFPILLLLWQLIIYFLNKKINLSGVVKILITAIGAIGHVVAITVILLNGTLSDALLLVLPSTALSLFLSPNPNNSANNTEREEKS